MKTKNINTFLALLAAWLLLPQVSGAYYNPSTGRWLTRDPVGEPGSQTLRHPRQGAHSRSAGDCKARDGGLYCFVRSNPLNAADPYGLAYYCQSATVYIFLDTRQEPFNAGEMLAQLRAVVPEQLGVYWKVFPGNPPPGSHLGFQGGAWPGVNCNCLYFVQADVVRTTETPGQLMLPVFDAWGYGNAWIASAYPNRFKWNFDQDRSYLPANWEGRPDDAGWDQFSGFIMAHEVVHAVGGRHTAEHPRTLMSPSGTWAWLNFNVVPVAVSTSIEVRNLLLDWYPGNVPN